MTNDELIELVDELLGQGRELEWLEFKKGSATEHKRLGQYISGLSNAANLSKEPMAYLLFGIDNDSLNVVGSNFKYRHRKEKGGDLDYYIRRSLQPSINFRYYECNYHGKLVEVFMIPAAQNVPVKFDNISWVRISSSLVELERYPDHLRAILNTGYDWSAEIVEGASIIDLDQNAIQKARTIYKEKHKNRAYFDEIDNWTDEEFLDKLKVTKQGKITNAALILLGTPESAHFLSPRVAQITWKLDTEIVAYEHFTTPLFLTVNDVLAKIRNVNYKFYPKSQLISFEVPQYDNQVILEALNNCIAHQDYYMNSRITVTETVNKLVFENAGKFFDGVAEDYFLGKKIPKQYRNKWLLNAMVTLNMIDSMGFGIYKMVKSQKERYFPLPDYSKSNDKEVVLEIYGHEINEQYSQLLMERMTDLSLTEVINIDRIQKGLVITDDAAKVLKMKKLIEGRKPNYIISAEVAELTDKKAEYTLNKGLDKATLEAFILKHIDNHGYATREEIDTLLNGKLPDFLTDSKRKRKIENLLQNLRKRGLIKNIGKFSAAKWVRN